MEGSFLYQNIKESIIIKNRKVNIYRILGLGILFVVSTSLYAQEVIEKEYVSQTFSHWQLINNQTTEMIPKKGYEFRIQHRFGAIQMNEDLFKEFLGMDLIANIRISFGYALGENFYMGVGRTKFDKTYDFEAKYRFLRQTKDNSMPVSVVAYLNTAIWTKDYPQLTEDYFYADSTTVFNYKFAHRVSYNTQLVISRKFSNKLSLQIAPIFIYKNLALIGKENHTAVISMSGRFKLGMKAAIIFEYSHVLNNRSSDYVDPVSIGVEWATVGHTFQFVISSTQDLLEQNIYTQDSYDYTKGYFLMGFNIKRTFWRKK